MHHEVALAVTAVAVAALTLGQPNPIGGWTFLMLFAARLSSKLNLFLGAPNFSAEFFPAHLRYLTTYLRKGPVSALYPVSIAGLALAAYAAARPALDASPPAPSPRPGTPWSSPWPCWRCSSTPSWPCRCPTGRSGAGPCPPPNDP